jgi:hypothetical protein
VKKPKRINHSFSRVNTFSEICELRYAYDLIHPETEESFALARGSHVHTIAEVIAQGASTHDAVLAASTRGHNAIGQDAALAYAKQIKLALKAWKPRRIEEWFRSVGDVLFIGKIDLEGLVNLAEVGLSEEEQWEPAINDWKTTASTRNCKQQWEAERSLQLQIYCAARGVRVAGFTYLFQSSFRQVFVRFTDEQIERCLSWLEKQTVTIEGRWGECWPNVPPESDGYINTDEFSLARFDHPLCCKAYCRHWDRCLGKDSSADKTE